ncbi:MAG: GAF domain-containing protein [Candidatus Saliniplasma sp.]
MHILIVESKKIYEYLDDEFPEEESLFIESKDRLDDYSGHIDIVIYEYDSKGSYKDIKLLKNHYKTSSFIILSEHEWIDEIISVMDPENDFIIPKSDNDIFLNILNKTVSHELSHHTREKGLKDTENKLKEKERKIKKLYQTAPDIESAQSLNELYKLTIDTARGILGFDVCSVLIEEDRILVIRASTEEELVDNYSTPIDETVAGKTFRTRKSIMVDSISKQEEAKPTDDQLQSAISIPIGDVGVFQALSYEEEYYGQEDLELAELLISHVNEAIKRVSYENELEDRENKLKTLYQITPEIEASRSIDEIYDLTLKAANKILGFDDCSIEIEENGYLVVKASTDKKLLNSERISIDEGVAGRSFINKEPYLVHDIEEESDAIPSNDKIRSGLTVPLGDHGVFVAVSFKKDYYDETDLELAKLLVSHISEAVKRVKSERALKESEERYRAIVESAITGIGINDPEKDMIFVNKTLADMLGYSKEEMIGMNISDFTEEKAFKKTMRVFQRRQYGKKDIYESVFIQKDGKPIDVLISTSPITDADGNYIGEVSAIQDITEKKKIEEREKFLHSLLRHDLKNKSQIIQGYLQLLWEMGLEGDKKTLAQKAVNASKEQIELIQKVRKLSKIERMAQELKEFDLKEVLEKSINENKDHASNEGFRINYEDHPSYRIKGGTLLSEVFHNLINNSIKHSGGSQIRIKVDDHESEVKITVEDDGNGIPEDIKEDVFTKGFKGTNSKGSGLGLFLVKRIIENYGGRIELDKSTLGGARFDIYLQKFKQ